MRSRQRPRRAVAAPTTTFVVVVIDRATSWAHRMAHRMAGMATQATLANLQERLAELCMTEEGRKQLTAAATELRLLNQNAVADALVAAVNAKEVKELVTAKEVEKVLLDDTNDPISMAGPRLHLQRPPSPPPPPPAPPAPAPPPADASATHGNLQQKLLGLLSTPELAQDAADALRGGVPSERLLAVMPGFAAVAAAQKKPTADETSEAPPSKDEGQEEEREDKPPENEAAVRQADRWNKRKRHAKRKMHLIIGMNEPCCEICECDGKRHQESEMQTQRVGILQEVTVGNAYAVEEAPEWEV